jgi:hypothetical protein
MAADGNWEDPDAVLWEWKASDSPGIPTEHQSWFTNPTDAKPVLGGDLVLLTASGGGVALIRLSDKAMLFYARPGGNPHSAELLPDGAIVTASSTGNSLKLWGPNHSQSPLQTIELSSAHGLCWIHDPKRLWAIGSEHLYSFEYRGISSIPPLVLDQKFPLPSPGGHDLQARRHSEELIISTEKGCWIFDLISEIFKPHPQLGSLEKIKSISEAPFSASSESPTLFLQATESWWSDSVESTDGNWGGHLPSARIYKSRWWYKPTSSGWFQPRLSIGFGFAGLLGMDPE